MTCTNLITCNITVSLYLSHYNHLNRLYSNNLLQNKHVRLHNCYWCTFLYATANDLLLHWPLPWLDIIAGTVCDLSIFVLRYRLHSKVRNELKLLETTDEFYIYISQDSININPSQTILFNICKISDLKLITVIATAFKVKMYMK